MFPFLFVIVMFKQRHHVIVLHIKQHFWMWLLWSSFGFVFFTYQSLLYPTIVQAGLFLRHGN
ncbi:multidrug resistance efflux transporter family protein [Staphylococcus nepalensis]|nr:multidrug resistance efflux transporter family protein [Staphylococcus nepalensis]